MMKIGRNDPCHCGSGKKYKKCHWKADRTAPIRQPEPQIEDDWDEDDWEEVESPIVEFEQPIPTQVEEPSVEDDPNTAAIYAFFDTFMAADEADKWQLVEEMLTNSPELCDKETAFELIDHFGETLDVSDYARFQTLMQLMQTNAPAAWEPNQQYVYDYLTTFALMSGDRVMARNAFLAFSEVGGNDLDIYFRTVNAVAWHGELDLIVTGMRRAWPSVNNSPKVTEWGQGNFAETLAAFEIVNALREGGKSADAAQTLRQRFVDEYELTMTDAFDPILTHLFGEQEPSADLADYERKWKLKDKDPATLHIANLVAAFCRYAWQEEHIPLSRIALGRDHLSRYITLNGSGELKKAPATGGKRKRRRTKAQKRIKNQTTLIPEPRQADAYLMEHVIRFLFTPYHTLAAFIELLPAWVRYLNHLALISDKQVEDALADLKPLADGVTERCRSSMSDEKVIERLQMWPEPAAEV